MRGHEREVEGHVAFVAIAEIGRRVLRPLVCLRQQHLVLVVLVERRADLLQHLVGFRQVLVVRALALDEIGDGIEPEPVHAHVEPEPHHLDDFAQHLRIVEVEVGLVGIETMPIVGLGDRVPGPVGGLRIQKDDPGAFIGLVGIAPDIEVARCGTGLCVAGPLEPGVLVGRVVDHEFGDDPEPPAMRLLDELAEVAHRPVGGVDPPVVGNVIAVVAQRRRVERQDPDRCRTKFLDIIQSFDQTLEIADAVAGRILKRLDVQLVDDRVLVPFGFVANGTRRGHGPGQVLGSFADENVAHDVAPSLSRRQIA